ncbi:MAG: TetR/AcrR family transcriptional regulator [Candidatus Sericytochromatia bacterium]|nr:TetR/AcrR family transcriptional regulator [Candidatus Sericytochromatia bacterium]
MDNRALIQATALTLFAARGYDAVGVQEIVSAANVTKPTLYHYFGNKVGLLQSIVQQYGSPLDERMADAADYQGDLPLTLNRVVKAHFQSARGQPDYYRLFLSLWFAPPASEAAGVVAERFRLQRLRLETLFEAAARDHGNMRGRQQAYAITFLGMISSYISLFLHGQAELDDDLAFRAVQQFMHGIYS